MTVNSLFYVFHSTYDGDLMKDEVDTPSYPYMDATLHKLSPEIKLLHNNLPLNGRHDITSIILT